MASKRAWSWKEDYREVVSDAVRRSKEGSVRAPLRIRVLTYNILANRLVEEHYWQLYQGIPKWILDFNYRLRNLCAELELCKPDVVCLQVRPSRRPITKIPAKSRRSGRGEPRREGPERRTSSSPSKATCPAVSGADSRARHGAVLTSSPLSVSLSLSRRSRGSNRSARR